VPSILAIGLRASCCVVDSLGSRLVRRGTNGRVIVEVEWRLETWSTLIQCRCRGGSIVGHHAAAIMPSMQGPFGNASSARNSGPRRSKKGRDRTDCNEAFSVIGRRTRLAARGLQLITWMFVLVLRHHRYPYHDHHRHRQSLHRPYVYLFCMLLLKS
jgi:hypothetical protein